MTRTTTDNNNTIHLGKPATRFATNSIEMRKWKWKDVRLPHLVQPPLIFVTAGGERPHLPHSIQIKHNRFTTCTYTLPFLSLVAYSHKYTVSTTFVPFHSLVHSNRFGAVDHIHASWSAPTQPNALMIFSNVLLRRFMYFSLSLEFLVSSWKCAKDCFARRMLRLRRPFIGVLRFMAIMSCTVFCFFFCVWRRDGGGGDKVSSLPHLLC